MKAVFITLFKFTKIYTDISKPPQAGCTSIHGDRSETYNNNLTLNFPVLVDYNYGLGSSLTTTKPYGIFVGLGYQSVIYGLNTITSGYVYNAGFRFINFTPDKPVTTHKFQIEKEAFMRLYFPDDNIPNQIIAFGLQLNFPLLEVKQL